MSSQRLTFLYPTLFRLTTARLGESTVAAAAAARSNSSSARRCRRRHNVAHFGTSTASGFGPRVGKGIEPKPLGDVQAAPSLESHMKGHAGVATASTAAAAAIPLPPPDQRDSTPEQRKDAAIALDPAADSVKETLSSPGVSSAQKKADEAAATAAATAAAAAAAAAATVGGDQENSSGPKKKRATGPMDAVLHMEPPENAKPEDKPPHLTPPPYVHHFDSYSLVKQLEDGGYTQDQAITAMKAVRTLLAHNLDVAQGGLISKSDVENETYLFRAACAELSTEVKNNRRIADEALRQQRTMLQHEVDNTSQALNQELLVLNDNVRGMFSDRKMAVREEHKKAEGTASFPFPLKKPLVFFLFFRVLCICSSLSACHFDVRI